MADVTSAPTVPPPTALYPQPPQQQQGILSGGPGAIIDLATKMQQNYALQQELKARAAIGNAYQGALQPDGTLDNEKLVGGLRGDPASSWMLPDAMTHVLGQQTQQFNLRAQQDQATRQLLGSLPEKATREDVYNYATQLVRIGVPPGLVTGWINSAPRDKKGFSDWVANTRNTALSPGELSTPTPGPPGAGGEPTAITRGQFNRMTAGGGSGGAGPGAGLGSNAGMPTGLAPGVATRQEGAATTDIKLADELSREAEGSQQRRALLGNIMDLSDKFEPGPGASESKVAKAFINRNIPLPEGWKFDQKSIASQEEFAKQAAQFAQKQFDTIGGTGTDTKFNSAFSVSPNEALSKMGIKGISSLLMGNEDAIQAKNKAWLNASADNPNLSYRRFSQDFQSKYDPRVFQFRYLSPKDRQGYLDKMEPQDQARLLQDMTYARKQGWVNYGSAPGSRATPTRSSVPATPAPAAAVPPAARSFAPATPEAGSFADRWAPVSGARPGRHIDGSPGYFIADPNRPGKYLSVQ